jgi:transposase InsO family protein
MGVEMKETFLTAKEFAKYEEIEIKALYQSLSRCPEKYTKKTCRSENGGWDRLLISSNSLSPIGRRNYLADKYPIDISLYIDSTKSTDGDEDEAWYVGYSLNAFLQKNETRYYEAIALAGRIKEYLAYDGDDKTEYTEAFAAKLGMSGRSLRRKVDQYFEGSAWALEMKNTDGKNYDYYKILALCRKPKSAYTVILNAEMKSCIENIWFDKTFSENRRNQKRAYAYFSEHALRMGWYPLPSYQTVNRYINELNAKHKNEKDLATKGIREFRRNNMIKRYRDTASLQVMELVQGDGHTFDFWCTVDRENGHQAVIKPYLVAFIDTRSRCLPGWAVCEVPCSETIKQVLMHMIHPKVGSRIDGVPRYLLLDNGKEFTSKTMTGRPRTERFSVDSATEGFFKSIEIEADKRSLPYQGWTKAQIERFFGTLCTEFSSWFASYTGTLTGSKTEAKVKKDIKGMFKRGELPTIEEVAERFEYFLNTVYHVREHEGLRKQNEESPIPMDVFTTADRYYKPAPPLEHTLTMLMECEARKVTPMGIIANKRHFQHELLAPHFGQWVNIRYNPMNPDYIFVYDKNGEKICEVSSYEGLDPIAGHDDARLKEHMMEQNRQIKRTRESLKQLRTPYEERIAARTDSKDRKVLLPGLKDEPQQVVSMPKDKQYRDEMKSKKAKHQEDDVNEFYAAQAEKFYKKTKQAN